MKKPTLLIASTVAVLAGASWLAISGDARAQTYPDRPIRMIVPFAAGGGSDSVGRVIAQKLTEALGQQVVVENRPGAGGTIGAAQVVKSAADGYTLLLGSTSELVQYPNVSANVPYDPQKDLAPIALIATVPLVLTAAEKLPVKSVQDVIDHARKNPGKLNYGSAGTGSTTHLAMELFAHMSKTDMVNVSYKGSAPVVTDLLAGQLDLAMPTMSAALPHAQGGKLKMLGVSTSKRAAALPNVPTIGDSGVPGYATGLWTGLMAPAGTPKPIIDRLHGLIAAALKTPEVQKMLATQGAEPSGSTPEEFAAEIKREFAVWRDVVKATGIKIQ
jgi:tripartite-type tricarboxylate transporter receptor subunit TctC